jgi:ribosome-associated translation inhibitor RaiA
MEDNDQEQKVEKKQDMNPESTTEMKTQELLDFQKNLTVLEAMTITAYNRIKEVENKIKYIETELLQGTMNKDNCMTAIDYEISKLEIDLAKYREKAQKFDTDIGEIERSIKWQLEIANAFKKRIEDTIFEEKINLNENLSVVQIVMLFDLINELTQTRLKDDDWSHFFNAKKSLTKGNISVCRSGNYKDIRDFVDSVLKELHK